MFTDTEKLKRFQEMMIFYLYKGLKTEKMISDGINKLPINVLK